MDAFHEEGIGPGALAIDVEVPLGGEGVGGGDSEAAAIHVAVLGGIQVGAAVMVEDQFGGGRCLEIEFHARLIAGGAVVGHEQVGTIEVIDAGHLVGLIRELPFEDGGTAGGDAELNSLGVTGRAADGSGPFAGEGFEDLKGGLGGEGVGGGEPGSAGQGEDHG